MTTIFHTADADPAAIEGQRLAVVGYGNQGRSWALNLRDSGVDVRVCVRADATRDAAEADGFATQDVERRQRRRHPVPAGAGRRHPLAAARGRGTRRW